MLHNSSRVRELELESKYIQHDLSPQETIDYCLICLKNCDFKKLEILKPIVRDLIQNQNSKIIPLSINYYALDCLFPEGI